MENTFFVVETVYHEVQTGLLTHCVAKDNHKL